MNNDKCGMRIVHLDKVERAKGREFSLNKVGRMVNLFKACGDPGRLRILRALLHEEMCVCDLAAMLEMSESAVSHQLRLLRALGLVANRREGVVLYYRPVDQRLADFLAGAEMIAG